MSSSPSSSPTLAIFGATGGSGASVLRRSLDAGLHVNVLARTPSKLTTLFPAAKYPNLTIHQGDIRDAAAVKRTLTTPQTGKLVDIVVSSIGMVSGPQDKTLCEDGVRVILAGIKEIQDQTGGGGEGIGAPGTGPRFVVVSSTGISAVGRDIPLLMVPVYKLFIGMQHADKRKMEAAVQASGTRWCIVRPSMLVNGESKGMEKLRVGIEVPGKKVRKEIGYTISREDVGLWIFEELVSGGGKGEWEGKMVSLTY